jgi:hypothetical protein
LRQRFDVVIEPNAPIVICGPFGKRHVRYRKTKVLWTGEPWPYTPGDYDFTVGFEESAAPTHLRFPLFVDTLAADELDGCAWELPDYDTWRARPHFCNFIYSNADSPVRNEFFDVLSRRRHVISPSSVRNNAPAIKNGERHASNWRRTKIAYQQDFRFTIAFESMKKTGYTSEKITDALHAGTIPIYCGNDHIDRDIKKDAFIDAADFSSLEELADYVIAVDEDRKQAARYLGDRDFLVKPVAEWADDLTAFFGRVLDLQPEQPRIRRNARAGRLMLAEGARRARSRAAEVERRLRRRTNRA